MACSHTLAIDRGDCRNLVVISIDSSGVENQMCLLASGCTEAKAMS